MHIYVITNTAEYNCLTFKHEEWILRIHFRHSLTASKVFFTLNLRLCNCGNEEYALQLVPCSQPQDRLTQTQTSSSWKKKEATHLLTRELAIWWDVAQSSGNRPLTDFVSWVTMCSIGPDLVQKLFSGHICTAREGHCRFFLFFNRIFGFPLFGQLGTKKVNAWMTIPKRVGESLSLGAGLVKSCFQEGTVMAPAPRSLLTSH